MTAKDLSLLGGKTTIGAVGCEREAACDLGSTPAPSAAARPETPSSRSEAVTSYCSLMNSSASSISPLESRAGGQQGRARPAAAAAEPLAPPCHGTLAALRGITCFQNSFYCPKIRT